MRQHPAQPSVDREWRRAPAPSEPQHLVIESKDRTQEASVLVVEVEFHCPAIGGGPVTANRITVCLRVGDEFGDRSSLEPVVGGGDRDHQVGCAQSIGHRCS